MSTSRRIFPVAATLAAVLGCTGTADLASAPRTQSGDGGGGGVTVIPPSARLPTYGQQAFAATPPTVTWSVKEVGGGNITTGGLYTAPGTTGSFTVLAFEPVSATTVQVPITVTTSPAGTYQGLTIPTTHPRLWFDATRLAAAKAWYPSHTFTTDAAPYSENEYLDWALRGLLTGSASDCRVALSGQGGYANQAAIPMNTSMAANASGGSTQSDYARWYGQQIIATYDWCWFAMTPTERTTFIANANAWVDGRRRQSWGDVPMHQNNYYWGFVRNEISWAIASYEDSPAYPGDSQGRTYAQVFLDDAIQRRYENDFVPGGDSATDSMGGVGQEGTEYGPYLTGYPVMPFATAGLMGRRLHDDTHFWKEAVYPLIYSLTPSPTTSEAPSANTSLGYIYFTQDDITFFGAGYPAGDANFMTIAAMNWPSIAIGQHARQWLATTGVTPARWMVSVDPGGTALSFSGLPLDYYARAMRYLYARSAWTPTATTTFLQLGERNMNHVGGHQHVDWGSFQIWRNGRFLSRESGGYAGSMITGYGGTGSTDVCQGVPHNLLLVAGSPISLSPYPHYTGQEVVVTRLESQPGYAYAAADLSASGGSTPSQVNTHFVSWVREFWFLRGLETLVVLDRVQSSGAGDTKTFVSHCETVPATGTDVNGYDRTICTVGNQALVTTTLLPAPANVVHNVWPEGGSGGACSGCGQRRIEIDTTPGSAQSYILTVLQAKDASAAALTPTVVDNGTSYTLTLDGSNAITFNKGMTSSGGTITVGGATNALRTTVQGFTVTDSGPAWQ